MQLSHVQTSGWGLGLPRGVHSTCFRATIAGLQQCPIQGPQPPWYPNSQVVFLGSIPELLVPLRNVQRVFLSP
ncbi:Uncharacterized protein TCM_034817 [Theobroma cacao]|uniref:Uncharacterized protein n=1 Tax=Theobroma cacao TaxID=3641 RepID=A0A061FFP1_THECC|nr:Uncharacterized protein TCM_034817 [Theobroma cacao]